MPSIYYTSRDDCTAVNVYGAELCFSIENCTPTCTDFLLSEPQDIWNCNLCQYDPKYYHPFVDGDTIHLQTQFVDRFNPDPQNPVDSFGTWLEVELYDLQNSTETPIQTNFANFTTRAVAAHTGDFSYQILEMDTAALPDCWAIRIIPRLQNGTILTDEILESQQFKRVICDDTVVIRSLWDTVDCCGNYYGEPNAGFSGDSFVYNNSNRFHANFVENGGSVNKTTFDDDEVTATEILDEYIIALRRPIAPYAKRILKNQLIGGKEVYINGVLFRINNFSLANEMRSGKAFLFDVVFFQRCELDFYCE